MTTSKNVICLFSYCIFLQQELIVCYLYFQDFLISVVQSFPAAFRILFSLVYWQYLFEEELKKKEEDEPLAQIPQFLWECRQHEAIEWPALCQQQIQDWTATVKGV